jgi:hypothetical protein
MSSAPGERKNDMKWIKGLCGKWRLMLGFCPYCNSDAPVLYDCPVCEFYTGSYPPAKNIKQTWWERYKETLSEREGNG